MAIDETIVPLTQSNPDEFQVTEAIAQLQRIIVGMSQQLDALQGGGDTDFSGDYNDLTNIPTSFPPSPHTHVVADITDFPTFATVAFSGDYADLINTPGPGFSGSYNDLTDVPASFPPSAHTHDAGDITSGTFAYDRLPFTSANVSSWNTAYDRSATGLTGGGNSSITLQRQGTTDLTLSTSHTHSYADLPISSTQVANWDTAFSWGNHASVGYAVSGTGSTQVRNNTQLDARYSQTDTDTTYSAGTGLTLSGTTFSVDNPVTATQISNWDTAYGWGDFRQFGLGTNIIDVFNSNTISNTRFYRSRSDDSNSLVPAASGYGIHLERVDNSYSAQIEVTDTESMGHRTRASNGTWLGWKTLWDDNNLSQPMTLNTAQTVSAQKSFISGVNVLTPSNFWSGNSNFFIGTSLGNQLGYFGTNGSFGVSLLWNGYRNTSAQWESLGINGFTAGGGIEINSGGILFRYNDDYPTGAGGTAPTLVGKFDSDGGFYVGSPTGGSQGYGTGNFQNLYKQGQELNVIPQSFTTLTPPDEGWATQLELNIQRQGQLVLCNFLCVVSGVPASSENLGTIIPVALRPGDTGYFIVGQVGDIDATMQLIVSSGGNVVLDHGSNTPAGAYRTVVGWYLP